MCNVLQKNTIIKDKINKLQHVDRNWNLKYWSRKHNSVSDRIFKLFADHERISNLLNQFKLGKGERLKNTY